MGLTRYKCAVGAADMSGRTARAAAKAAGSALALGAASAGVLLAQGYQTKRSVGPRRAAPHYVDGRYGNRRGVSLRLAFLGDSSATGLGAAYGNQTPGALLAEQLADRSGRPVLLSVIASVGARTEHLADQVDRALIIRPDVAVIFIGVNDLSHFVPVQTSVRRLAVAVARLREGGSEVVVGTCPDLGTVRPIRPPLRNVMRRTSRRLAQSQGVAVRAAGGWPVSLGHVLGPEFAARPREMFSSDQFHPSEAGYAAMVGVLTPVVLAAAGYGPQPRPALPVGSRRGADPAVGWRDGSLGADAEPPVGPPSWSDVRWARPESDASPGDRREGR